MFDKKKRAKLFISAAIRKYRLQPKAFEDSGYCEVRFKFKGRIYIYDFKDDILSDIQKHIDRLMKKSNTSLEMFSREFQEMYKSQKNGFCKDRRFYQY
jgi:hypothetical protein